jgi:hypothetical protein
MRVASAAAVGAVGARSAVEPVGAARRRRRPRGAEFPAGARKCAIVTPEIETVAPRCHISCIFSDKHSEILALHLCCDENEMRPTLPNGTRLTPLATRIAFGVTAGMRHPSARGIRKLNSPPLVPISIAIEDPRGALCEQPL